MVSMHKVAWHHSERWHGATHDNCNLGEQLVGLIRAGSVQFELVIASL